MYVYWNHVNEIFTDYLQIKFTNFLIGEGKERREEA